MEKVLLNFEEFKDYLGIGKTKAREIITRSECPFRIKIGNRLYAHKEQLDKYIQNCMRYGVPI